MMIHRPDYHAFLLRLWREDGRSPWRVTLENPHTGEKQTFATPEQFWDYLQGQLHQPEKGQKHDA